MKTFAVIAASLALFSFAPAFASSDLEEGLKAFNDSSLGSNGKSCSSCHAEGQGLENACDYDVPTLQEFVNFCIRDAMKGTMLPEGDSKIINIEKLIRSTYCKQK